MAIVQRVGARMFILRLPNTTETAPSIINLGYQLWAELQDGGRVMAAQIATLGGPRAAMPKTADGLGEMLLTQLRHPEFPQTHRESQWGGLVEDLARIHVHTDAETLMRLPFELEPTDEALEVLGSEDER